MKYRKTVASVALATASVLTQSVRADSTLYSSISGPTTTLYQYTALERDGGYDGIGDDYTTNYASITLTGMSFYGGLTRSNDYLAIEFFSPNGALEYTYTNGISAGYQSRQCLQNHRASDCIPFHRVTSARAGRKSPSPAAGMLFFAQSVLPLLTLNKGWEHP